MQCAELHQGIVAESVCGRKVLSGSESTLLDAKRWVAIDDRPLEAEEGGGAA